MPELFGMSNHNATPRTTETECTLIMCHEVMLPYNHHIVQLRATLRNARNENLLPVVFAAHTDCCTPQCLPRSGPVPLKAASGAASLMLVEAGLLLAVRANG